MKKLIQGALIASAFCLSSMHLFAGEIANYPMDGSVVDTGPNTFNGQVVYGSTYKARDRHGKYGKALGFGGTVVEIPQFRNYDFGDKLTISF